VKLNPLCHFVTSSLRGKKNTPNPKHLVDIYLQIPKIFFKTPHL
jgi:hypothetical protein